DSVSTAYRPAMQNVGCPGQTVRWSRRRLLARLAATVGAAAALAPVATLPRTASAQERRTPGLAGATTRAAPVEQVPRIFENRVGWAYSARWRKSRAEIVDDLRRMRDLGCNVVYIGHNSAGNTDPDAYEPGLAPANWYAIAAATPSAGDAHLIT